MTWNPIASTRPYRGAIMARWEYLAGISGANWTGAGTATGGMSTIGGWSPTVNANAPGAYQQRTITAARVVPLDPRNNQYPAVINVSSYPSVRVRGRRYAACSIFAPLKLYNLSSQGGGWGDAYFLNSLIQVGTDQNTDPFALGLYDATSTRIWDWSRCSMITLSQRAMGGTVNCRIDFLTRWGDATSPQAADPDGESIYSMWSTAGTLPSGEPAPLRPIFTIPAVDPGDLVNVSQTSFGGLDGVRGWSISLMRGQVHQGYVDGTLYASDIESTMFTGVFTVDQTPGADMIATDSANNVTINVGPSGSSGTNGAFTITPDISLDDPVYTLETSFGTIQSTYSLVNLATGGNPASFAPLA